MLIVQRVTTAQNASLLRLPARVAHSEMLTMERKKATARYVPQAFIVRPQV